jgi:hypothetical protein
MPIDYRIVQPPCSGCARFQSATDILLRVLPKKPQR